MVEFLIDNIFVNPSYTKPFGTHIFYLFQKTLPHKCEILWDVIDIFERFRNVEVA